MKLWRGREQDLEDEIRDYVERDTQENIASGMPPDEAALLLRPLRPDALPQLKGRHVGDR